MTSPSETVHILGAGSIGLMVAAYLSRISPVVLIRRPGCPEGELRFRLREADTETAVTLPQRPADTLEGPVRRMLLCTKAQDALSAVEATADKLAADAALLLMQNGMGSQEAIVRRFPALSVYAASTTEGAYRPEPDTVVHAGRGITRVGRLGGPNFDWTALFRAAGFDAETAEPIQWHLANKLRVNALINPLTVVYNCLNGELLERPDAVDRMRRLGEEADRLLGAAGYAFDTSAFAEAVRVARATAANRSSMLQDARAGRTLEVDYITGYLLSLAGTHGLSVPAHQALYRRLLSRA